MRRLLVALLAVMVLSLGACASNGSSSSSSSSSSSNGTSNGGSSSSNNGSSSNGSSSGSSNDGSSNGSSNNGGSSNDSGGGDGGNHNNGGTTGGDGSSSASTVPVTPPSDYTLPERDSNGNVTVPDEPPKEIRNESPQKRLSDLPPVPRGCLDDDLTLLDVFVPGAAIPVRLLYCLLYVGTIARVPSDVNGGSSGSGGTASARTDTGQAVQVQLVPPNHTQRPLATLALILLIVVVAGGIGYTVGKRKRAPA